MKSNHVPLTLALATALLAVNGCGQKDTSTAGGEASGSTSTMSEIQKSAAEAATEVKQSAEKVAAEVKQNVTTAANSTVDAVKAEAQSLIDKTKALINDKKYEDALASLKQLSNLQLTPEQQKIVNDLKAQLEKLMSSQVMTNAASALNNLLKK